MIDRIRIRTATSYLCTAALGLLVSGCFPIATLRHDQADSPESALIALPDVRATPQLTRADILDRFGPPLLAAKDDSYYVYVRSSTGGAWMLYYVFPYIPMPMREKQVMIEQAVGIWFDGAGTVVQTKERRKTCVGCTHGPAGRPELEKWMQDNRPEP